MSKYIILLLVSASLLCDNATAVKVQRIDLNEDVSLEVEWLNSAMESLELEEEGVVPVQTIAFRMHMEFPGTASSWATIGWRPVNSKPNSMLNGDFIVGAFGNIIDYTFNRTQVNHIVPDTVYGGVDNVLSSEWTDVGESRRRFSFIRFLYTEDDEYDNIIRCGGQLRLVWASGSTIPFKETFHIIDDSSMHGELTLDEGLVRWWQYGPMRFRHRNEEDAVNLEIVSDRWAGIAWHDLNTEDVSHTGMDGADFAVCAKIDGVEDIYDATYSRDVDHRKPMPDVIVPGARDDFKGKVVEIKDGNIRCNFSRKWNTLDYEGDRVIASGHVPFLMAHGVEAGDFELEFHGAESGHYQRERWWTFRDVSRTTPAPTPAPTPFTPSSRPSGELKVLRPKLNDGWYEGDAFTTIEWSSNLTSDPTKELAFFSNTRLRIYLYQPSFENDDPSMCADMDEESERQLLVFDFNPVDSLMRVRKKQTFTTPGDWAMPEHCHQRLRFVLTDQDSMDIVSDVFSPYFVIYNMVTTAAATTTSPASLCLSSSPCDSVDFGCESSPKCSCERHFDNDAQFWTEKWTISCEGEEDVCLTERVRRTEFVKRCDEVCAPFAARAGIDDAVLDCTCQDPSLTVTCLWVTDPPATTASLTTTKRPDTGTHVPTRSFTGRTGSEPYTGYTGSPPQTGTDQPYSSVDFATTAPYTPDCEKLCRTLCVNETSTLNGCECLYQPSIQENSAILASCPEDGSSARNDMTEMKARCMAACGGPYTDCYATTFMDHGVNFIVYRAFCPTPWCRTDADGRRHYYDCHGVCDGGDQSCGGSHSFPPTTRFASTSARFPHFSTTSKSLSVEDGNGALTVVFVLVGICTTLIIIGVVAYLVMRRRRAALSGYRQLLMTDEEEQADFLSN